MGLGGWLGQGEGEVALGVVRGVGYEPEVRECAAGSEALKVGAGKGKVGGVYVARGEPKDVCQLGQGAGYAASGFECAAKVEFFA